MWRPARRTTNATGHSCWPPGLPDYVPLRHWVRAHPVTHPTHSDAYQPITGTQFSHTPACIWTWVVLMCIELSCEARQHPRGCSSVGRALRSHRRGRGFDYHQLHEGRFHSTGIGLFHFFAPDDHTPPLAGAAEHSETGGSGADTVKTAPMVKTTPSRLSVDSPASGRKIQRPLVVQEPRRWRMKAFSASAVMPAKPSMEAHCGPSALALRLKPS